MATYWYFSNLQHTVKKYKVKSLIHGKTPATVVASIYTPAIILL